MKLGIDIDGVLADFNQAYIATIRDITGKRLPEPSATYPDVWHYERAAGVTPEEEAKVWDHIRSTAFWGSLHAMTGTLDALAKLTSMRYAGVQTYFITSRPGQLAKYHTEKWLSWHGMDFPTVLIADKKGPVARGLQLDVFIDDKPENNQDVIQWSPTTRVYLIDQPYNEHATSEADYGHRVKSVGQVLALEFHPKVILKEAA